MNEDQNTAPAVPESVKPDKPMIEIDESQEVVVPEYQGKDMDNPPLGIESNLVQFGEDLIEIKPTKLRYARNHTSAFYKVLQRVNVIDLLAIPEAQFGGDSSPDKMLFDWLVAVTDDPELVQKNYNEIDPETIYKMLDIFIRVNKIHDEDPKKM